MSSLASVVMTCARVQPIASSSSSPGRKRRCCLKQRKRWMTNTGLAPQRWSAALDRFPPHDSCGADLRTHSLAVPAHLRVAAEHGARATQCGAAQTAALLVRRGQQVRICWQSCIASLHQACEPFPASVPDVGCSALRALAAGLAARSILLCVHAIHALCVFIADSQIDSGR